ncbi:hypothetical protein CYMTET_20922 [Cymbomonas tetramitiformis]|uniref:Uncharacterized protein n=1 Tax=Cymbomonas tetramitiformis TaxID=36881 RepID=A0AAE0L3R2_9CHLO|nr:hypothetical protein CYMTET_20922 [Cymbomonas tetramitiformis]
MVALERMWVNPADVEAYKLFWLIPRLALQPGAGREHRQELQEQALELGALLVALLKDGLHASVRSIACEEALWSLMATDMRKQHAQAFGGRFCGRQQEGKHSKLRAAQAEAIEQDFPELWAPTDLAYGVEVNHGRGWLRDAAPVASQMGCRVRKGNGGEG